MKKLIIMAATVLTFAATGCSSEESPYYTNPPRCEDLKVTPNIFTDTGKRVVEVESNQSIVFSGTVNSRYACTFGIYYQLCPPEDQEKYKLGDINDQENASRWNHYWSIDNPVLIEPSRDKGTLYVWNSEPVENSPFSVTMPRQQAGSVVRLFFQLSTDYRIGAYGITIYKVKND